MHNIVEDSWNEDELEDLEQSRLEQCWWRLTLRHFTSMKCVEIVAIDVKMRMNLTIEYEQLTNETWHWR